MRHPSRASSRVQLRTSRHTAGSYRSSGNPEVFDVANKLTDTLLALANQQQVATAQHEEAAAQREEAQHLEAKEELQRQHELHQQLAAEQVRVAVLTQQLAGDKEQNSRLLPLSTSLTLNCIGIFCQAEGKST